MFKYFSRGKTSLTSDIGNTVATILVVVFILSTLFNGIISYNYLTKVAYEKNMLISKTLGYSLEEHINKPLNTLVLVSKLYNSGQLEGESQISAFFDTVTSTSLLIENIQIVDIEGKVLHSTSKYKSEIGTSINIEDIINEMNPQTNKYYSGIYSSPSSGKPLIKTAYYSNNEYYIAYLGIEKIGSFIESVTKSYEDTYVSVNDSLGYYIYDHDYSNYMDMKRDITLSYHKNNLNIFKTAKHHGVYSVLSLTSSDMLKWTINVYTPVKFIIIPIYSQIMFMSFIILILTLLSYKIFSDKNRKIKESFQRLIEKMDNVSNGDYLTFLKEKHIYREFEVIDNSFNLMSSNIVLREEEIVALNENLEELVNQRTEELEVKNTKLIESLNTLENAKDMLVQSEKMASLGQLVAGVAHEINTPVGIGVTLSSFMNKNIQEFKEKFDENQIKKSDLEKMINESIESSDLILTNLLRASELINSFKKVAGDISFDDYASFELVNLLRNLILSLKTQIKGRNIEIALYNLTGDLIEIFSNPGAISQIISNLITNTFIHAFPENREGKVSIMVERSVDTIQIIIEDDGIGISKENLKKIFDPFFTTNRKNGGTGLGLNIVYNLVVSTLNGDIRAQSKEGSGSKFIISFPVKQFINE